MWLYPAIIYLTLLMCGAHCVIGAEEGDESDESGEFHVAKDCGYSENTKRKSSLPVKNPSHGYNFTIHGTHVQVTLSNTSEVQNTTSPDSGVGVTDRRRPILCVGCRKHHRDSTSSNRPSNEVNGNGWPFTQKRKPSTSGQGTRFVTVWIEFPSSSRHKTTTSTTLTSEVTKESNYYVPTFEANEPNDGKDQQNINQGGTGLWGWGFSRQTTTRTTTMAPQANKVSHTYVSLEVNEPNEKPNINRAEEELSSFLPSPSKCGLSLNTQIIGGTESLKGKWPWIVAYGYKDRLTDGDELLWLCEGSLVTEKHTLTVAHCTSIALYYISVARIGDIYLNQTLSPKAQERPVFKQAIVHPQYKDHQKKHDIAIVTLKTPFTGPYKPICLPFRRAMRKQTYASEEAYVAGWGATEYGAGTAKALMEVKIPIVENSYCRSYYNSMNVSIEDHHICAGGQAGKDSCRGDSGGPLMVKNKDDHSYYLVGLVSFGHACGAQGVPGVYTRVTSYIPWLEEVLK